MSLKGPVFSIVMPCYNGERYISEAIASVIGQHFTSWELIIVNDGSTDRSSDIITAFAATDDRIVFVNSGRLGSASAARNLAFTRISGRYVTFLDCDDVWFPEKLTAQFEVFSDPTVAFCCSSYRIFNVRSGFSAHQFVSGFFGVKDYLSKRVVIGCLTVAFDAQYVLAHGNKFDVGLLRAEDVLLWVQVLRLVELEGRRAFAIDVPLACYRVHFGGKSHNKIIHALAHWNIYRHRLGIGFFPAIYFYICYLLQAVGSRFHRFFN